jgi:hypothetical protein
MTMDMPIVDIREGRDGEAEHRARLIRVEALVQSMARDIEEIHRALGLETDMDGAPVGRPLAARPAAITFDELAGQLRKYEGREIQSGTGLALALWEGVRLDG